MSLNNTHRSALRDYQAGHGRTWKAALRKDWMNGDSPLQELRNASYFGPAGLDRLTADELFDQPELEYGYHHLRVERVHTVTKVKAWEPWSMVMVYPDPKSGVTMIVWWMAGREKMSKFVAGCMQRGLRYEFQRVPPPTTYEPVVTAEDILRNEA